MAKNDDFTKLEHARAGIQERREAIEEVERAPIPFEAARAQVRTWIQRSAEQLDVPGIGYFSKGGFSGPLVLAHFNDRGGNRALERVGMIRSAADDLTSVLCAVAGEEIERVFCDRLEKTIKAAPLVLNSAERTEPHQADQTDDRG